MTASAIPAPAQTPANRRPRAPLRAVRTGRSQAPAPLDPWLGAQAINLRRHAAALGPLRREEFEAGPATVTEGHIQAANELLGSLRRGLLAVSADVATATARARADRTTTSIQRTLAQKARGHDWVMATERVWDFYFELFTQRQSQFGSWLLACDRIALSCYQAAYTGIESTRSVPAPGPFCYMRTGFSPATFRRGLRLRRLGRLPNPFPLIQLPYHRLVNPWTLGAVLHEVCHNLQNDLGLATAVPHAIEQRLRSEGLSARVAQVYARWNRETFADLGALLLGGPAVVASLMDVVGRAPATVVDYSPTGPHPTPWIRVLISCELLRRMRFSAAAEGYKRTWLRAYPDGRAGSIPEAVVRTAPDAIAIVVDTICYQPYASLGNKALAECIRFRPKDEALAAQAAQRMAAGTDPGVVPPRYLIGAARIALDRRYARPETIARRFYEELAGR